jgi:antitoxin YefM
MMTSLALAEVRANLPEMIGRAVDHHERIVITVHGKPAAVLLGVHDFESMQETLEIMSEPDTLAQLGQSKAEAAQGLAAPLK